MDAATIRWLLGLGIVLLAGATTALYARLRAAENLLAKLTTQVEPLWGVVQSKMIKELHHPHRVFKEADDLLIKLDEGTITPDERAQLLELMEQRIVDPNPDITLSERKTAGGLAFVMEKVQADEASDKPFQDIKMVGVRVHDEPE